MLNASNLDESLLKKLVRQFNTGEYIFKQGDPGNSMFIIMSGNIQLLKNEDRSERHFANLGPGEVIGEKAILQESPHKRSFSAQASTDVSLLEIDKLNLRSIQVKVPEFTIKLMRVLMNRLDQANELISILQNSHPAVRFAQYIKFYAKYYGKRQASGIEVTIAPEEIQHALNMSKEAVETGMRQLSSSKILLPQGKNFLIVDENAVEQLLPQLKEKIAA